MSVTEPPSEPGFTCGHGMSMSPEFATHALSRLSAATTKGWDNPPPAEGEPGAGEPSGRSSATVSLATPATKMSPLLARATPKGFDTPMPVSCCALFGSPDGYCVTLSFWQLAIQMLPPSSETRPWGNAIPPWV